MQTNNFQRIVIKVGSSLITGEDGAVRKTWLASLAGEIAALKQQNKEVVIVTSGAVALGRRVLGYGMRKLLLEEKQAAAACGQAPLLAAWNEALGSSASPALVLLTADDSTDRRRYLNARNTLDTLLENDRVIPVINENDTVATAEIRFGDNDRLSARVAQMIGADLLILLSDIDGLYSADPRKDKNAQFIAEVANITPEIEAFAGGAGSDIGSGGMVTKIAAAKIAVTAGCDMVITRGDIDHPLKTLMEGGKHTRFVAKGSPMSARKKWIAGDMHPIGKVVVDGGAAGALAGGKSLLPAGVVSIGGGFERGDTVTIVDVAGRVLGKGLIAYDAEDAQKIIGKHSRDFESLLGFKGRDVLIHRDDMVLD
ncbi:MAG: glutamate 5-kinase [Alphaproteobacteria bacterium]|nr:glutamate 5-kinase [Alphaproteobacteria bacterium]